MTYRAENADAVVIGAGPNGLVAANALVDAGWDVVVVEAEDEVGGAVRSAELFPGYTSDLFSAFYPLAAASPVVQDLGLEGHGLVWRRSASPVAHVVSPERAAVLWSDVDRTAAALDDFAPGDGSAWLEMFATYQRVRPAVLDALFTVFPPVRAILSFLRRTRVAGLADLARLAITPAHRLGEENFAGEGGRVLLSGNAMHSDLGPNGDGGGFMGWLLVMLAQDVGFPVPEGGAGRLAGALRSRAESGGAQFRCGTAVDRIHVQHGSATGVHLADGTRITARRAVLADVAAPALYTQLLAGTDVPERMAPDLRRFAWDHSTVKLNWALDRPIPWRTPVLGNAGTVHLSGSAGTLLRSGLQLQAGDLPEQPFVVLGQMARADPTRAPEGCESAWAYTHLPQSMAHDEQAIATVIRRAKAALEDAAPGFGDAVVGEVVQRPADLEAMDRNLVGGAINGGTSALYQQLFFRPTPGLGRPETPVANLYLASAGAHPGGGVHGACGWNAARAALSAHGRLGAVHRALTQTAWNRLLRNNP
ncbi:phytoene desaturase family protein [Flexivirga lutea]